MKTKTNFIVLAVALGVVTVGATYFVSQRGGTYALNAGAPSFKTDANTTAKSPLLVTAPGRVEPVSEEINVTAEMSGKLKTVSVEEGDQVQRGQIIATLENSDWQAQVAAAQARLAQGEAALRKVVNGARQQERREAQAMLKEAEAVLENTRLEVDRYKRLFEAGDVPRQRFDQAEREFHVAQARTEAARQRFALVDAEAREEDRSKAEADVSLMRAQLAEAQARLAKTIVRAPITGVVLRKRLKAGESVSLDSPNAAIVTLADVSTLRVRADVDETDVAKIQMGQEVYVTAEAFGTKHFRGHVVRIGKILGKKNIRTDEPTERVDTKILETLIELDQGSQLPLGLRVDTFIKIEN